MLYKNVVRPLLFLKDPEESHEMILGLLSKSAFMERALETLFAVQDPRLHVGLGNLSFPNPVGLAAGFDKNGKAVLTLPGFGFGFIEIGAVTAEGQPGNPKPRLFRLPKDRALINRLGFNNEGAEAIARSLEAIDGRLPVPLGINIGRTKIVDNQNAVSDYLFTFEKLYRHGDYFTLNVSSPNTPNLRELQEKSRLSDLLQAIQEKNYELAGSDRKDGKPVLLKVAPDMELTQLDEIIEIVLANKLAGIVATNATAFMREKLATPTNEPGGLSGPVLRKRATDFVRHIYRAAGEKLAIIGVGGVATAEDAYEKIKAGAAAVQIYTGFIYEGPAAVRRINRGLLKFLDRDGLKNVSELVGIETRMS